MSEGTGWTRSAREALIARPATRLADLDRRSTPGWDGGSADAADHVTRVAPDLATLQEQLFAEGRSRGSRSVLLVLQGMDTSGKGGITRHVVGLVDPQGVQHRAFAAPTPEEREHDYLWRIRRALPTPGHLGVFDRSHYEDVLIVRVHELVRREVWSARYEEINAFEQEIVEGGTTVIKVLMAISADEQRKRLLARLDNPAKYWKFDPSDIDERTRWDDYDAAYQDVIDRTSTVVAPWYVVPSDRRWYARLAVTQLLLEHLTAMDLSWPPATFDVEAQRARLLAAP